MATVAYRLCLSRKVMHSFVNNKACQLRRVKAEAERERKKERRRRRKEKREHEKDEAVRKRKRDHDRKHKDGKGRICHEKNDNQMGREHENTGLENSSLTEELGEPIVTASVCDTFNNGQEIRAEKPQWYRNGCSHRGGIVLGSFRFHSDSEAVFVKRSSSTCTWMDISDVHEKCELAHTLGKQKSSTHGMVVITTQEVDFKRDQLPGGSQRGENEFAADESFKASTSTFSVYDLLETESEYRKLIVNWVPPPLQIDQTDSDNQDWLWKRNLCRCERTQNITVGRYFHHHGSYPYARYFPDADIYAFPYTIPF